METKGDTRRLAAIPAGDMVGFSRLMEVDESGTLARLKAHRVELIDPAIAKNGGRIVKTTGDGMLVEFASALDAGQCAVEIQRRMARRNADMPDDRRIEFRFGVNLGDIIVEADDVYGNGVNIAARLEAFAKPGGVCISDLAYRAIEGNLNVAFEDAGEHALKNIAQPVRIWRWVAEAGDADSPRPDAKSTSAGKPSLAVLAFENMSGDAEQAYFSDGISEDVITDLSKVEGLHVIARNSSFVYKGQSHSIAKVARELGVRYVLEGSVRKAGNRVRVTAQWIDSVDGGHVWADRFDRDLTDIFAVQDELTQEIVAALKVKLTPDEQNRLVHKGTANLEAYHLFLRGREQVLLHTKAGNTAARELLGTAVSIDPRFAAAHAYTAFTHVIDYVNGWSDEPEASLQTGLAMAREAVEMSDREPRAHFALAAALIWARDLDGGLAAANRCLALAPNSPEGFLTTAHAQIFRGDAAAALDALDTYRRLDPHHPEIVLHFLAEAHISLGQFEQAIEVLKERLERSPNSWTAFALLASCCGHLGRIDEGKAALAELLRINPDFSIERRRRMLPFRNPADFERRVDGMRKVGLQQ